MLSPETYAQEKIISKVQWNGYTQLRFTSNFNDVNSFAMRRMKLWLNSSPEFNKHWGYKVQATLSSKQDERFLLQDVMAYYHTHNFKINLGQFVPQYSLQRFQPDYLIPLTERADVINALIPNGTLGVRDLGFEVNYIVQDKKLETWFGVFNGYGIKNYRFDNSGVLLTHKTAIHFFNRQLTTGYSVMYRKADNLQLLKILPENVRLTANDFRYNFFAKYQSGKFMVQTEYLWARLDKDIADGYYIMAAMNLGRNQVVASWNQYSDLVQGTDNSPVVHLGYNYLLNGDKLKIMVDNGAQIKSKGFKNYFATIQMQIFFN